MVHDDDDDAGLCVDPETGHYRSARRCQDRSLAAQKSDSSFCGCNLS